MRRLAFAVTLLGLASSIPLAANAETCNTAAATPDARTLSYSLTEGGSAAVPNAVLYGFDRQAVTYFPDLRPDDAKCRAASLTVGGAPFALLGDDGSVVPRRTSVGAPGHRNAYLVATLKPEAASRISRLLGESVARGHPEIPRAERSELVYMLAAGSGAESEWDVYGFFDAIPDTPRLAQAMCAAIQGKLPPFLVQNIETKNARILINSTGTALDDLKPDPACVLGPP